MPNRYLRTVAATVLTLPGVMGVAYAAPLPDFCVPPSVVDNVCTARLVSVTADTVNGTITGPPAGGGTAITLAGQVDVYKKSTGFGAARPAAVQQWDDAIERVANLSVDPSDPNWYANAKSRAFLPRTLNDLATQFPPDTIEVRFTPDDAQPGTFRLVFIQPTPR